MYVPYHHPFICTILKFDISLCTFSSMRVCTSFGFLVCTFSGMLVYIFSGMLVCTFSVFSQMLITNFYIFKSANVRNKRTRGHTSIEESLNA